MNFLVFLPIPISLPFKSLEEFEAVPTSDRDSDRKILQPEMSTLQERARQQVVANGQIHGNVLEWLVKKPMLCITISHQLNEGYRLVINKRDKCLISWFTSEFTPIVNIFNKSHRSILLLVMCLCARTYFNLGEWHRALAPILLLFLFTEHHGEPMWRFNKRILIRLILLAHSSKWLHLSTYGIPILLFHQTDTMHEFHRSNRYRGIS